MAITEAMCTSFKQQLFYGAHDFDGTTGDTFKIALYTSSATLSATTTAYTTTGEATGTNYTAGGNTLSITNDPGSSTTGGGVGFVDFDDITWGTSTITARGALIYNTTPNTASVGSLTNPAVAVLDFGSDKSSTSGNFQIQFPAFDGSNAILRIGT